MKKVKKEKKGVGDKVITNDKAVFIFDKIRELLNLPTTLTQKKRKFKITITAEKYKIGEMVFKTIDNSEVKILKSTGIFSIKSVVKSVKNILKKIRKEARAEAKKLRKVMKAERKLKRKEEKKVKKVKKGVKKEKKEK